MEGSCSSSTCSDARSNPLHVVVCHICLTVPTNPVATACGHIFCWPCLYQWLQIRFRPCPVCGTMLKWSKKHVIPINLESSEDGAAGSTDGSNNVVIPQRLSSSATTNLSGQFPTRNAVLRALQVIESVHERLQNEQTVGFFRTRRLCFKVMQENTDITNPVQRQLRQSAENLYQQHLERIKRERQERSIMAADIAGLQGLVIWSNQHLPGWWTSGMLCLPYLELSGS